MDQRSGEVLYSSWAGDSPRTSSANMCPVISKCTSRGSRSLSVIGAAQRRSVIARTRKGSTRMVLMMGMVATNLSENPRKCQKRWSSRFDHMFSRAIRGQRWLPKYLSSDHDPLYKFHQWQANLRILEVTEIKTVPYVPLSHPFVERLIGTIRREYLDHMLFWTSADLENKLLDFRTYFNHHRTHHSREGRTPHMPVSPPVANLRESMQSCGVITLRPRSGAVPRLAGNPGANVEMRFPRCHSAHECEHRGNSGQCAGSISSVASSPFVWRQSR